MADDEDDLRLLEMEATTHAMAEQLESLERANAQQWNEAKIARSVVAEAEEKLESYEADIPMRELELLKARQEGDALETDRLEAEVKSRALHKTLAHLQLVQRLMSTTTLTAREDATTGSHDNSRQLGLFDEYRKDFADKTEIGLRSEVQTARGVDETLRLEVETIEKQIEAASKESAELTLACETLDQALENVLRESKDKYRQLSRVNIKCAALSKELEVGEQRTEGLGKQCRAEENASEALRKQCIAFGIPCKGPSSVSSGL
mmetsp:Transcript_48510/g.97601  ORF Transcript_48510/g.97601 Transcript_48510/m.97601 type:complete len:264 (-) Transcript_48510:229-1020(-)|eukprot:CAMPEP_0171741336 /NCGR_PEP_ID=MMETSP0991-20121206/35490_1 /TAXON_ID=483369 /ORGANISM="non described non described, Strain CCMP2098" /LENGTH=263 /DNA_ID=CAMNT_0012339569 /DNA_START=25 /DNA_END=816 /DNA_ORIENTATION=+